MAKRRINKNYALARLGSSKVFWKTHSKMRRLDFKRLRSSFKMRIGADTAASESSAFRILARGTYIPILVAIFAALVLYLLESKLSSVAHYRFFTNNFIGHYLLHPMDTSAYVQLLTTVAAVTGVFLALYFTAVSTVIANAYTTVPQDVRELLIRDRLGNVYVKIVSFLTALAVILLSVSAAGGAPLHLVPPLMIFLSCFGVFALARLGQRAFFLSDPTLLSNSLAYDFSKWSKRATSKGWHWRDANFQEHYRKQAYKAVSTLVALAKISGEKPELQGDSYPKLLNKLIFTVRLYFDHKQQIPSSSRWFGSKYEHKQWYLTESTELESATQTDTALQPKETPDHTWVEYILLGHVLDALEKDVSSMRYESLHGKLSTFTELFSDIGQKWLVPDGVAWCDKVTDTVLRDYMRQDHTDDKTKPAYLVAITDVCASLPLALELGFIKALKALDVVKLRQTLNKIDWSDASAPYRFSLPLDTIKALEQIHEGAQFEDDVKAPHQAGGWYVVEFAFNNLDWTLYRQWGQLMKFIEEWYAKVGTELAAAGHHNQAAAVYTRAIELAWKLDSHVEALEQTSAALREGVMLDFRRPEWDWAKERERVLRLRNKAIDEQAKLIPDLLPQAPDSDIPDYFGGAVHRTGEACFDALMDGDVDRFKELFRPYFLGILGAFDKVRPQVIEWEPSTALTWLTEPMIDLYEISGYAYVLAEYHSNPAIWEACKEIWDQYLSSEQQARIDQLAMISYHHQNLFGVLSPRSLLRTHKQMTLGRLLRSLATEESPDPFSDPPIQHPSALIRSIAPRHELMSFTDAIDIFTYVYLMEQPAASSADFGMANGKADHLRRATGVTE